VADPLIAFDNRQKESAALEAEALALWKQYGFFLPSKYRGFLVRLADFLNWKLLRKEL
jgi:hypothetical protein